LRFFGMRRVAGGVGHNEESDFSDDA
jgi:hypothetical protein